MKTARHPIFWGIFLSLLWLCSCATGNPADPERPAEVAINPEAGRGGFLTVTVKLESGEELPMIVDTGSGTCFDRSLAPKLGKPLGTTTLTHWGVQTQENVYAMPKLYLGGVPLVTPDKTFITDFEHAPDADGHPAAVGMIGCDCLRHYCVQLDFAAGRMRFLDEQPQSDWGRAFPIVALNARDERPAVAENLLGQQGPHSLIDSGYPTDGWLMPQYFKTWTNTAVAPAAGEARFPTGRFGGEKYPLVALDVNEVESDGIGLRFLARHLVTLDFPRKTLYLKRQQAGPPPNPRLKTTRIKALEPVIADVIEEDAAAAREDLARLERSDATTSEKDVARKLAASLDQKPKATPAEAAAHLAQMPLGDARPELAEVGWLKPSANRIPLNGEIPSPLLDSGRVYATGLFAHAPSRYVYDLGGKWKRLRGEAGLHTQFQGHAFGVIFVIKTDGKEVFRSGAIHGAEHVHYDLDVTDVKTLDLVVEQAQEQNGGNWGLWLEPTLFHE